MTRLDLFALSDVSGKMVDVLLKPTPVDPMVRNRHQHIGVTYPQLMRAINAQTEFAFVTNQTARLTYTGRFAATGSDIDPWAHVRKRS